MTCISGSLVKGRTHRASRTAKLDAHPSHHESSCQCWPAGRRSDLSLNHVVSSSANARISLSSSSHPVAGQRSRSLGLGGAFIPRGPRPLAVSSDDDNVAMPDPGGLPGQRPNSEGSAPAEASRWQPGTESDEVGLLCYCSLAYQRSNPSSL